MSSVAFGLFGRQGAMAAVTRADAEALPTKIVDVVVIGGGAGGLCAALSAAEAGAGRVLLLEKNPRLGGDTLISGGYFNAVIPERQRRLGVIDSVEQFEVQMLETGRRRNDPDVVHVLASRAGESLLWLEAHGMRFLQEPHEIFGSGWRRCFKPVMSRGQGYLRALTAAAYSAEVDVRTSSPAEAFVCEDIDEKNGSSGKKRSVVMIGVIASLEGKRTFIRARRGVVLASGGFAANRKMLESYAPAVAALPVDTQPGSTGEMTLAAGQIGAALVNMSAVECVPGSREGIDYPIRLDYVPGKMIMVSSDGRRFVDETSARNVIAAAILRYGDAPCWAIADSETVAALDGISQKNIYRGLYAGEAFREKTVLALARRIGVDPTNLATTFREQPASDRLRQPPFWAVQMHLRVHVTLGGVRIDSSARVLDTEGRPIERLWAAGACTGSVHGVSRIGGNGINTAVVFGRIAGAAAAKTPHA